MTRIILFTGEHPDENQFTTMRARQLKPLLEQMGHTVEIKRVTGVYTVQKLANILTSLELNRHERRQAATQLLRDSAANPSSTYTEFITARLARQHPDAHIFNLHAALVNPDLTNPVQTRLISFRHTAPQTGLKRLINRLLTGIEQQRLERMANDGCSVITYDRSPRIKIRAEIEMPAPVKIADAQTEWGRSAVDRLVACRTFLEPGHPWARNENLYRLVSLAHAKGHPLAKQEYAEELADKIHQLVTAAEGARKRLKPAGN
ncbi:MAG: hypothetical protein AABW54_02150 [Candidatus Micrarchaeota archaeon]